MMAEPSTAISPPSKRLRSDTSSEEEIDLPEAIFPSDEDCDTSMESCEIFYPSEESNLGPLKVTEFTSSTENNHSKQQSIDEGDSEDHELKKIGRLLVGFCCDKLCLRHLTATDIISTKADYVSLTRSDQRLYLFNKIKEGSCGFAGKVTTKFFIAGKEICASAWSQIYNVSSCTMYRIQKRLACGEEPSHGNLGKRRVNTKAESVSSWMDAYFNLIGDKMPHKNQLHLPSWETQKDIYYRYVGDMKKRGISEDEIAGISIFYKVWTDEFSNVVIPQVWTMLCLVF